MMIVIRVREPAPAEHVFETLPIRIGRAAENDVVLLDDTVSLQHAVLETTTDGKVVLRDLGSRNGTWNQQEKVSELHVEKPVRVLLGLVEIEILPLGRDITREVDVREWDLLNRRRSLRHHIRYLLLGVFGGFLWKFIQADFWSPEEEHRWGGIFQDLFFWLIGIFVGSFLLLIILRAIRRKVRIADTLEAVALIVWIPLILEVLDSAAYYLFSQAAGSLLKNVLGAMLIIGAAVYVAGLRRAQNTFRFRLVWAVSVAFLLVLSEFASHFSDARRHSPNTDYSMKPPIAGFTGPSIPFQTYLDDVEKVISDATSNAELRRARRQ